MTVQFLVLGDTLDSKSVVVYMGITFPVMCMDAYWALEEYKGVKVLKTSY